ncbi:hypothetical protein HPB51_004784 [Rhipicephalus microplus]|uniref:Ig-like domain-containing protein n=1 Tax=Rhipicephalus microplus TaxID=6941 RepID=A0A9J6E5B4_RHIMP|nr:hypothetical protein HPB51_004784 [Rhipicephalus microplus]
MCVVTKGSSGPFQMTWYRDGEEVRSSDRITVVVGPRKAVLNIDDVRVEDVANYTCTAANRFGDDSISMPLVVTAPPKLGELLFPSDVAPGDEVAVICVVKKGSQGPYQITWEKDGEGLSGTGTDARVSVSPLSAVSVTLRIANLRADDVGNYSCTARNRFGSDSVTAQLVVHAPPKLKSTGFPTEVSLGDDTVVTCFVKKGSSGPYKMNWYKDGDAVGNTDRITVVTKASSVLLSIEGVRVADIGNYTCTAANEFGVDTLTMSLVVTASDSDTATAFPRVPTAPVVGKFGFSSDVSLGDEVMESCVVKKGSSGPYHITLLKDGEEVRSDHRVTVSSHSKSSATLRIASLRTEDVGNYTCTASNQYGSDSVTAALLVHGNRSILYLPGARLFLKAYVGRPLVLRFTCMLKDPRCSKILGAFTAASLKSISW